ncbi:M48 family metallopeptidase [Novosphingobium profundi]|uniref:M48 family metallopeptidase n=1 Tax=Novosphingobium profundi TaxID=1774954 RepID=UPI001BD97235|nr:SprT family zinc-dependent metalloprotease [Novosphingobium profundi]MBT0667195.1 M48 family metallopeptidase [Novosphingobium profundi]
MLDWLRRDPRKDPEIELAGRAVPIIVRRLERARRMTMRLAPDGSAVRISMPPWVRSAEALAFAEQRRDWLERQLRAVPEASPVCDGAEIAFRGTPHTLFHDPAAPRRVTLGESEFHVGGPASSLVPRLARWMQAEAQPLLEADLAEYCARAAQPTPKLALSSARRRWGSCAADGAIRINWRLIMAPDLVRRSVVAHEVAHLVHFDHSPAFHHCLKTIFEGSVHEANRWLKLNGRALYLPFG